PSTSSPVPACRSDQIAMPQSPNSYVYCLREFPYASVQPQMPLLTELGGMVQRITINIELLRSWRRRSHVDGILIYRELSLERRSEPSPRFTTPGVFDSTR